MKRARISFNVNGDAANFNPEKLLRLLERYPVSWLLIKNNLGAARLVKQHDPGVEIVYRAWPDDDAPTRYSYLDRLQTLISQVGDFDCWLYLNNESGFSDHVLDWSTNIIRANRKLGYNRKLMVGSFSSGTPEPNDWKSPSARRFLEAINDNQDLVRLSLHEYMGAVWTSGFAGGIQPEQWPKTVAGISTWHVGRWRFLAQACQEMGMACPKMIITEHGMDDTSDIKTWLDTLIKTPGYLNIRGWKSCEYQWRAWWPLWSAQRAYFEQVKQADAVIYQGSPVESQLVFAWGDSGGWEGFDVQEAAELHGLLMQYAHDDAPLPAPKLAAAGWYTSEDTESWHIRADGNEQAASLGKVTFGDKLLVLPEPHKQTEQHTWQRMRVYKVQPSTLEIEGWVATGIKLKKQSDIPQPPAPAPRPGGERILTADDLTKLAALHRQLAEVYATAAARSSP